MFKPGQEVLCIDSSLPADYIVKQFQNWITQDKIYTIRRVENSLHGPQRLLLDEVVNPAVYMPQVYGYAEPGFSANRFRSLLTTPLLEVKDELQLVI